MKTNRKPDRAPPRYRNDKPPRASLPRPSSYKAVMQHINGKKAFYSQEIKLHGTFQTVQGVVKSYVVAGIHSPAPLFVWDKQSQQWYLNKTRSADQHPCCPDKTATQLPDFELRYLMQHGLMDLMEAKVNGYFNTPWIVWDEVSGSSNISGTIVFNANGTFRIV